MNGEPVLYDANRTPGALRDPIRHADTVNVLSEGIFEFIAHAVYTPANDRCMSDLAKIGNLNPKAEVARGCDASSQ